MNEAAWLRAAPFGGYRAAPMRPAYGPVYAPVRAPYVGQAAPAPASGQRPMSDVLMMTLAGLALFGGAGALVGWLVFGTQQAALVGALVGISAPPAASSLLYMQQGQGGRPG